VPVDERALLARINRKLKRQSQKMKASAPASRWWNELRGYYVARSGCCFPSYERIAEKAGCARSTVAEAIKALEWADCPDVAEQDHPGTGTTGATGCLQPVGLLISRR
jgi:Helix-turn-helix domain